jgi:hypothetical protein
MSEIRPTHTCFDDALDLISEIVKEGREVWDSGEIVLVHALVAPAGEPFAHAWVENQFGRGVALWSAIIAGQRKIVASNVEEYRRKFKVVEETRYTPVEALRENERHVNYGPWVERYREFCGLGPNAGRVWIGEPLGYRVVAEVEA